MDYIQRKRTRGFRLPAGTICCTRPGPYANPYRVGGYFKVQHGNLTRCERIIWKPEDRTEAIATGFTLIETAEQSVAFYRREAERWSPEYRARIVRELQMAEHLACWCGAGEPCHVQDVLIPLLTAAKQVA